MEVLLVVPPWLTRDGNIWHGVKGTWPPLGLLYVASYAESRGHDIRVLDAIAEKLSFENIERYIGEHQPRTVGLTGVTTQIHGVHRVADIVKRVSPDSTVVVGGVHATALPDEVLSNPSVDYVIRGEGEVSFAALVEGEPIESIAGLSYRTGDSPESIRHNPVGEPITDLDALPTPAYHLTKFELYRPAVGAYRRLPAIAMMTARGCPGNCIFCTSARTPLRSRSPEHVVDEIQELQARYGIREISFYDDTFTVFKRNVSHLCELMIERGIDVTWCCFARADCVNRPLLVKMRDAGCHQILFGIESADPQILRNIRKPIRLERVRRAVRMAQDVGINVRAAFMLGNVGETVETMRRTIAFAKELNPDIALFNITVPFPGTEMFEWAKKHGYLRTRDWRNYDIASSVLELPTVSGKDVNRMYREAHHSFYFRPRYLLGRLGRIRSLEDVKMNFRALRSVIRVHATEPTPEEPARGFQEARNRPEPVPA